MTIYRHNENKKLYVVEHWIKDIKHLNNNAFAGIYAYPYKWDGDEIIMNSKDDEKCKLFVEQTFTEVSNT
jgi:hypothetical protein